MMKSKQKKSEKAEVAAPEPEQAAVTKKKKKVTSSESVPVEASKEKVAAVEAPAQKEALPLLKKEDDDGSVLNPRANFLFARALGKVLTSTRPEEEAKPILSKKKHLEVLLDRQLKKEKDEKKKVQARQFLRSKPHIKCSEFNFEEERKLQKIATRGVIKLFNAVAQAKAAAAEAENSEDEEFSKEKMLAKRIAQSIKPVKRTVDILKREEEEAEEDDGMYDEDGAAEEAQTMAALTGKSTSSSWAPKSSLLSSQSNKKQKTAGKTWSVLAEGDDEAGPSAKDFGREEHQAIVQKNLQAKAKRSRRMDTFKDVAIDFPEAGNGSDSD